MSAKPIEATDCNGVKFRIGDWVRDSQMVGKPIAFQVVDLTADGVKLSDGSSYAAARLEVLGSVQRAMEASRSESVATRMSATLKLMYGLNDNETRCLDRLADAWNAMLRIKCSDNEREEFRHALHACEHIIALQVAKRINPEIWKHQNSGYGTKPI